MRQANRELQKSAKIIRKVQAGKIPPPDIKPETYIEYDWDWDALLYEYGVMMAWVVLLSFVFGVFWEML